MTAATGTAGSSALSSEQAAALVQTVRRHCGLAIAPEKRAFLELRVGRRLRALGLSDYDTYLHRLTGPDGPRERQFLAESLVTHTTGFFREKTHFDWLAAEGIPDLLAGGAGRQQDLVVWSAACSIGSELWTAGIVLDRVSRGGAFRWSLVGTDISETVLGRARQATFSAEEIVGLPEAFRRDYLLRSRVPVGGKTLYRVVPDLRNRATFAQANLLLPGGQGPPLADVAFLRNVLIYFDADVQERVVRHVSSRLRPGGYLITGHAETMITLPADMKPLVASIYRKD